MTKTPETSFLTATIDGLAKAGLEHLEELCSEAQTENYYFVPVLVIASVKDGEPPQLMTSTCMFARNQPTEAVAQLLKVVAAHLMGQKPEGSTAELDFGRKDA